MIGWDSNKFSLDGFSPNQGWLKIDLPPLHTIHITSKNKYRRINQIYAHNKRRGKVLYQKYRKRERHRVHNYLCHLLNHLAAMAATHSFEALTKQKMNRHAKKRWNRELQHTNWRTIVTLLKNKASIREIAPYYTSKICAR